MRRLLLLALACTACTTACAHRAPENAELWVPTGQDVPAVGDLGGAEVYVPVDATRSRATRLDARDAPARAP